MRLRGLNQTQFTLIISSLMLVACQNWRDDERYSSAIFSAEGNHVAAIFQRFESRPRVSFTQRRNFQSQIVLYADERSPQPLGDMKEGDVKAFYYQHEQGYLILGREGQVLEEEDGQERGSQRSWFEYERIDLNGQTTPLGRQEGISQLSCDGGMSSSSTLPVLRIIPNPSGLVLAKIESQTDCTQRQVYLHFLDAHSLEPLRDPLELGDLGESRPRNGDRFWRPAEIAWQDDQNLMVAVRQADDPLDHTSAQVYSIDEESQPEHVIVSFNCIDVPTASYSVRQDGVSVYADETTGEVFYAEMDEELSRFGCQE